jgi:hypothetical protein
MPVQHTEVGAFAAAWIVDDVQAEGLRHVDGPITLRPAAFEPAGRCRHRISRNP